MPNGVQYAWQSLACGVHVWRPFLVRNSETGCLDPDRMSKWTTSTMLQIYSYRSSYDLMDTSAQNVVWSVASLRPHLARYSTLALQVRISDNTSSCTMSAFKVISLMN
jgi:hypothetical protein